MPRMSTSGFPAWSRTTTWPSTFSDAAAGGADCHGAAAPARRPSHAGGPRAPGASVGRATAGKIEYRAGRERTVLRAQPRDLPRDLLDRAEAPHRNAREDLLFAFRRNLRRHRCRDDSGCHRVHQNAGFGELLAERLG